MPIVRLCDSVKTEGRLQAYSDGGRNHPAFTGFSHHHRLLAGVHINQPLPSLAGALKRNAVVMLGIAWQRDLMAAFDRLVDMGRVPVHRTI